MFTGAYDRQVSDVDTQHFAAGPGAECGRGPSVGDVEAPVGADGYRRRLTQLPVDDRPRAGLVFGADVARGVGVGGDSKQDPWSGLTGRTGRVLEDVEVAGFVEGEIGDHLEPAHAGRVGQRQAGGRARDKPADVGSPVD